MDRLLVLAPGLPPLRARHRLELLPEDFREGTTQILTRESALEAAMLPVEQMYASSGILSLMSGVLSYRLACDAAAGAAEGEGLPPVGLHFLSAGYGVVPEGQRIAPYRVSFKGLSPDEVEGWADLREIPRSLRHLLARPYGLAFLWLEGGFLAAAGLNWFLRVGGPTFVFCSEEEAEEVPRVRGLRVVPLTGELARRLHVERRDLGGEVIGRLLARLGDRPELYEQYRMARADIVDLL